MRALSWIAPVGVVQVTRRNTPWRVRSSSSLTQVHTVLAAALYTRPFRHSAFPFPFNIIVQRTNKIKKFRQMHAHVPTVTTKLQPTPAAAVAKRVDPR